MGYSALHAYDLSKRPIQATSLIPSGSAFGWLSRNRRMSKVYERQVQTSETLIEVVMIRLLLACIGQRPC
jgi:hypothetical protein